MTTKDEGFTQRILMALAQELADHKAHGERIQVLFEALAKESGIKIPEPVGG